MNPIHILLVEDNEADVLLVERSLRQHHVDYSMEVVMTGQEARTHFDAIHSAAARNPDILLLDLNLPAASGHELLEEFRGFCPQTPVLVITSSDSERDKELAMREGANGYFRKPSTLGEFCKIGAVVRDMLPPGRQPPVSSAA